MKYCMKCGAETPPNADFCIHCGQQVEKAGPNYPRTLFQVILSKILFVLFVVVPIVAGAIGVVLLMQSIVAEAFAALGLLIPGIVSGGIGFVLGAFLVGGFFYFITRR